MIRRMESYLMFTQSANVLPTWQSHNKIRNEKRSLFICFPSKDYKSSLLAVCVCGNTDMITKIT